MSTGDRSLALIERSERDLEDGSLDIASFSVNRSPELFVKAVFFKSTLKLC